MLAILQTFLGKQVWCHSRTLKKKNNNNNLYSRRSCKNYFFFFFLKTKADMPIFIYYHLFHWTKPADRMLPSPSFSIRRPPAGARGSRAAPSTLRKCSGRKHNEQKWPRKVCQQKSQGISSPGQAEKAAELSSSRQSKKPSARWQALPRYLAAPELFHWTTFCYNISSVLILNCLSS